MITKVKVKTIGNLQEGEKKDGTGKWYARDIVLTVHDGSMYPDEFVVRLTKEHARDCNLSKDAVYSADISFSTRDFNGRQYQDSWLRKIEEVAEPF